jgi:hypothetical protein
MDWQSLQEEKIKLPKGKMGDLPREELTQSNTKEKFAPPEKELYNEETT